MRTEIYLDALTADAVTAKTIKIFEDGGTVYHMPPHAKAYVNSAAGRDTLAAELPEPYLSAVLAVWGGAPTVETVAVDMEVGVETDA